MNRFRKQAHPMIFLALYPGWAPAAAVEHMGFEPTASTMRMWRAPNCANAPYLRFFTGREKRK